MAEYTRLTPEITEALLAPYDLGAVEAILPLKGGQANSSVKILTGKGNYTLSVCDEKNPDQLRCLTRVLLHLETHGFPTTRLVPTRNNKAFILHGNKPVYIKQFLPGRVCPVLSFDMVFQVGQAMARLHALEPPKGLPTEFPYGLQAFEDIFNTGSLHPYVDWLKKEKAFLEQKIDPGMVKSFIHGDLFWDNLLFLDNTLVAILDFEEACHYYRLYDMGMAAVGCCAQNGLFSMDRVKHLVAGYQDVSPLTGTEKRQLPLFMEYAAVAASFWRFRQYNIRYPSPEKKDAYLELSSLADQVHSMDESRMIAAVFK